MSNEKPEEQLEREKAAVASLRSAQSNMSKAIDRIGRLEEALSMLCTRFEMSIKHIPSEVYMYNSTTPCRDAARDAISAARKVL